MRLGAPHSAPRICLGDQSPRPPILMSSDTCPSEGRRPRAGAAPITAEATSQLRSTGPLHRGLRRAASFQQRRDSTRLCHTAVIPRAAQGRANTRLQQRAAVWLMPAVPSLFCTWDWLWKKLFKLYQFGNHWYSLGHLILLNCNSTHVWSPKATLLLFLCL